MYRSLVGIENIYSVFGNVYNVSGDWIIFSHRERGGVEAEKEERQLWVSRERKKIMDSVNGTSATFDKAISCDLNEFISGSMVTLDQ